MIADHRYAVSGRVVLALLISGVMSWIAGDLSLRYMVLIYTPIYLLLYVAEVGNEITARLKELGAFLPGDDEYDENTEHDVEV